MSCQKHINRHCVHHHKCSNPKEHQIQQKLLPAQIKSLSHKHLNKKYKPPLGTIKDNQSISQNYENQECLFTFQPHPNHMDLNTEKFYKRAIRLEELLQEQKKKSQYYEIESRKNSQKNKHLQSQMQYLRTQLDLLVNNHNVDIKEQIKRHLQQSTELNLIINKLSSQLIDSQKKVCELDENLSKMKRVNMKASIDEDSTSTKFCALNNKYNQLVISHQVLKEASAKHQIEKNKFQEKYQLLAKSLDSEQKSNKFKKSKQEQEIKKLQKLLQQSKKSSKKKQQLDDIQKKNLSKIIQELKQSLSKKEEVASKYKDKNKQIMNQIQSLKDDLSHAKKIVFKYQEMNKKSQNVKQFIKNEDNQDQNQDSSHNKSKQTEIDKKTLQKLKSYNDQQTLSEKIKNLQKQNLNLKNTISQLNSSNLDRQKNTLTNSRSKESNIINNNKTIINQELILSIGASEQFQKIVKQKNITIKKLMKEKAQLYNQLYENKL